MTTHGITRETGHNTGYAWAHEQYEAIVKQLRSEESQHMTHDKVEKLLEREGREMLRRMLQAHYDERSQRTTAEEVVVDASGVAHTHKRMHRRTLETMFGEVEIRREGHGGIGLASLHPLDGELNLPTERYSHAVRERVAEAASKESFDEVVEEIDKYSGAHVPKRQAEALTLRAAQDFDAFYDQQPKQAKVAEKKQSSGDVLVVTTDGKGVPMRKEDLRPQTQAAAAKQTPHLKHRPSKGEKPHRKRMATVAAVYTIEAWARQPEQIVGELHPNKTAATTPSAPPRPRPQNKRVWASLSHTPQEIIEQAFSEADARDPQRAKRWVALVDGNPTQLSLLQATAKKLGVTLVIILDLIHVLEYLWSAAWALFNEADPAAEVWVSRHLHAILSGHSSTVAAGLRRSATLRQLSSKQREPIDRCANYLLKYRDFLHYDTYLAAGFPIATGVIEGACRHLVKDRMELTGARWSTDGAEAVLRLRALRASGDFDSYWSFHLDQELQRIHTSRYANQTIPELV